MPLLTLRAPRDRLARAGLAPVARALLAGLVGGSALLGCGALLGLEDATLRDAAAPEAARPADIVDLLGQPLARVDKIDLLLVIDNSPSMGDKQAILADAVPALLDSFVAPRCLDEAGAPNGERADPLADVGKECKRGRAEFRPIVDLHVGVVSTSMGGFGSDACTETANPFDPALSSHANDRGHLLNRAGPKEIPIPNAAPSNFLSWFPSTQRNGGKKPSAGSTPFTSAPELTSALTSLVGGVREYGCGFEAPLESFYHFLVQPDPYEQIAKTGATATYAGLDQTILQQRADFLRSDSLVAIVVLSDEDDASLDPLSLSGLGWAFMNSEFPGSPVRRDVSGAGTTAPKGTEKCDSDPGDPACTSCQLKPDDPGCTENQGYYGPTADDMNVRFHKMKQRYGVDPTYPISRYVDGLTRAKVPDGASEHDGRGAYVGAAKCTNPLFAKDLPTKGEGPGDPKLCALSAGPRTPDLVFFAVLGGVPQDLLHFDPESAQRSKLTESDWTKLLGKDPERYDLSGLDPRMDQSVRPREGRPKPSATRGDNDENGQLRDWETGGRDLQYACTFELPVPVQCTGASRGCDCGGSFAKNPPLCSAATPNVQTRAKAYPTPRALRVARGLRDQGIVSSICPSPVPRELGGKPNPAYGYQPVVKSIVDRLGTAPRACLGVTPSRNDQGKLNCSMLVTLDDRAASCEASGLRDPDAVVLRLFREEQRARGLDTSAQVCVADQLRSGDDGACATRAAGWCYAPDATCPLGAAVVTTPALSPPLGAKIQLLCTP